MDNSRNADLAELHQVFNDREKPMFVRQSAYRTFQNIQRKQGDKKLAELRHRLLKAIQANDVKWQERFDKQIREHTRKMGYQ